MGQIWAQHRSSVLLVRHVPESDELPPKVTILDREDGHAWAGGCCYVRDPGKAPQDWTDVFKVLPAGSACHQLSVQHTHFLSTPCLLSTALGCGEPRALSWQRWTGQVLRGSWACKVSAMGRATKAVPESGHCQAKSRGRALISVGGMQKAANQ